ncbi:hypothetical protein EJB05_51831, partial [Eragrostis curvula]
RRCLPPQSLGRSVVEIGQSLGSRPRPSSRSSQCHYPSDNPSRARSQCPPHPAEGPLVTLARGRPLPSGHPPPRRPPRRTLTESRKLVLELELVQPLGKLELVQPLGKLELVQPLGKLELLPLSLSGKRSAGGVWDL